MLGSRKSPWRSTPLTFPGKAVISAALAGVHTGEGVTAFEQLTPLLANASMAGVTALGSPVKPSA